MKKKKLLKLRKETLLNLSVVLLGLFLLPRLLSGQIIVCTHMGSLSACLDCCSSQYDTCVRNTCEGLPSCGFCDRRDTACFSACDEFFGFSPTKPENTPVATALDRLSIFTPFCQVVLTPKMGPRGSCS